MAYQLKVTLDGTEPKVWRRLVLNEEMSFHDLNNILKLLFEIRSHVNYEFQSGGIKVTNHPGGFTKEEANKVLKSQGFMKKVESKKTEADREEKELESMEKDRPKYGTETRICDVVRPGWFYTSFAYKIGEWKATIVLEKKLDKVSLVPECIAGEMAPPPDDCESPDEYRRLVKRQDEASEEKEEDGDLDEGDDFEPYEFDKDHINRDLESGAWKHH
ncbi:MAG: plasmid pRiA4b ORF-3 family protein [Nanoarchaeota archaeon]|nr:plasmid pRiA4b ORF-3 family protein [Nanoarchaeota archaeon]